MNKPKSPVVIELDTTSDMTPATAPTVPETAALQPQAMHSAIHYAARRGSSVGKLFWSALLALVGFVVSLSAWNFVTNLLQQNAFLGWVGAALLGLVLLGLVLITLCELAALWRLSRVDTLRRSAESALAAGDLNASKDVAVRLSQLYSNRRELDLGREKVLHRMDDVFDVEGVYALVETDLLSPLDAAAQKEIEAAARSVAAITALVPLALADVIAALTQNMRMIRRIAEIYGGRSGALGSWRLTKTVMTHLVATGAVSAGDDLIGSLAGGGALAKISRRFGEGMINGALTARVGIAAIEICRPLAFQARPRPKIRTILQRALSGLFSKEKPSGGGEDGS